ncbi:MAG: hypothetical protein KIT09_00705 [Bryobacteraceae bacterium]|nr:hypothetical protein [Bryobacteraceae bacterium]
MIGGIYRVVATLSPSGPYNRYRAVENGKSYIIRGWDPGRTDVPATIRALADCCRLREAVYERLRNGGGGPPWPRLENDFVEDGMAYLVEDVDDATEMAEWLESANVDDRLATLRNILCAVAGLHGAEPGIYQGSLSPADAALRADGSVVLLNDSWISAAVAASTDPENQRRSDLGGIAELHGDLLPADASRRPAWDQLDVAPGRLFSARCLHEGCASRAFPDAVAARTWLHLCERGWEDFSRGDCDSARAAWSKAKQQLACEPLAEAIEQLPNGTAVPVAAPVAAAPLRIVRFRADASSVMAGSPVRLEWEVTGAEQVRIDPEPGTIRPAGHATVSVTEDTLFRLQARRGDVTQISEWRVDAVHPRPEIEVEPEEISAATGGRVTFSWRTKHATQVFLDGAPDASLPAVGARTVTPSSSSEYRLIALGPGGRAERTVSVRIAEPPPQAVPAETPEPSPLEPLPPPPPRHRWLWLAGLLCLAGGGWVAWHYSAAGPPASPREDPETVRQSDPAETGETSKPVGESAPIDVPPPKTKPKPPPSDTPEPPRPVLSRPRILQFDATDLSVSPGESVRLSWSVEGAEGVVLQPPRRTVPPTGQLEVSPNETTEYLLEASNAGGDVRRGITIEVRPPDPPPVDPAPQILRFVAKPGVIGPGHEAVLEWSVSRADVVRIGPNGAVQPMTGSLVVQPSVTTVYTLSAARGSSHVTGEVTVTVDPRMRPAPFTEATLGQALADGAVSIEQLLVRISARGVGFTVDDAARVRLMQRGKAAGRTDDEIKRVLGVLRKVAGDSR